MSAFAQVVPKSVLAVKALLVVSILVSVAACGKKKKSPPPPCGAGVSQAACGLAVRGHTAWSTELKTSNLDEKTKQPVPGSERVITVTYEFLEAAPVPQWRRTMVVESAGGNTGMYQQGTIKKVTADQIEFAMEQSSCDDFAGPRFANYDFTLYYKRSGGSLQLDTQPIVTRQARGLTDAIAGVMTDMVGAAIRTLLEQAFSFGSARKFLESGHGSFSLNPNKSLQQIEAKKVELGCFSTFGSGYSKSAIKPGW